ncbi:Small glutamine-rich tetratricopeptide repeat-containing protein 2 [Hondaea fermentalgiana]|uniref:Small glutamine-rich tetratricopeptide repeat-containing protein 2 n=1 Tax=Hondaea fermentalgiana TaxID=2315210 RepID=A0A2R5GG18_9STRA|nr:Small glutamine-rich tetratricopeptide repeat-containing protein 2 [Hondaea fermentalgiana]|eukprot:GBG29827.1 Small glutamine-rich tetratricopeptide repeat-containing protein 2 [Hondaea fermentalgiana]
MAEAKKDAGNDAFRAGDHEKAVKLYTEAIELDELNHVLYANRAAAYLALKQWEDARTDAKKCLAMDASFVKAYLRLATAEKELNNHEEALRVVKEGMKLLPSASGKKSAQKKSGVHEFRKLEKELKNKIRDASAANRTPDARATTEEAMMGGTQELGQRVMEAKFKYMQVTNELNEKELEQRTKAIISQSIIEETKSKDGAEVNCYRAMGKGFLMQDAAQITKDLGTESTKLASDIDNLKKGQMLMKRNLEDANSTLMDHLRRRQA